MPNNGVQMPCRLTSAVARLRISMVNFPRQLAVHALRERMHGTAGGRTTGAEHAYSLRSSA
jgi:hypothetical protein